MSPVSAQVTELHRCRSHPVDDCGGLRTHLVDGVNGVGGGMAGGAREQKELLFIEFQILICSSTLAHRIRILELERV